MPSWTNHDEWAGLTNGSSCPVCRNGPTDVLAELSAAWVTMPPLTPLMGYVCVVAKRHVVEPFELPMNERIGFWEDVNHVASSLSAQMNPVKLNYEIHGNTLPHLHLHLFPRQRGDRFEGRPVDGQDVLPRTDEELAVIGRAIARIKAIDPYASLKDLGSRSIAEIDARLERAEIDEAGWHREMSDLTVPAYIAAETPWEGSGKSGTAIDWEYSRSHIAHAVDRRGSFLDIGCANGYLLECLPRWTPHRLDRSGLDISAELVTLARQRLAGSGDRLWVGNALYWQPPQRFTYVRTALDYVPRGRRREFVDRLLAWCQRLIIGVFNEESHARPTEELLRSWGHAVAGRSERSHRDKLGMEYRVLWIDA